MGQAVFDPASPVYIRGSYRTASFFLMNRLHPDEVATPIVANSLAISAISSPSPCSCGPLKRLDGLQAGLIQRGPECRAFTRKASSFEPLETIYETLYPWILLYPQLKHREARPCYHLGQYGSLFRGGLPPPRPAQSSEL